jgi:hypothetical protein
MTCANRTWSTVFTIPAPTLGRWSRFTFVKAIVAITEVFQEASDMRRAAHRSYFLSDE